jgi:hypothetical protein
LLQNNFPSLDLIENYFNYFLQEIKISFVYILNNSLDLSSPS